MIKKPLDRKILIISKCYAPYDIDLNIGKLIELKGDLDNIQSWLAILTPYLTNRKSRQ